jgi:tRNA A-37 threonylcarbamoyl transferase component Bud32
VIATGQSIGNYRILNKIGTGGMGAVYLAEHPLIGKRVALKVIHRELAGNRDVVSRFFQEARAVNKIGNEHIVEIHDFGVTPEGDHFYIMEYLEGSTLASVLSRDKPLDVMRSLHIAAQIAAALAAAHAAGIIHRDLKPDNIMLMSRLGDQDFVKVLDFGLAKVFSAATAVKTAAGVLLGTPQYMSPEACESKRDIDHRTDIYALGVLLFQMTTGELPFDGESMGEVLVKQVTMLPPAPRGMNPAIPPSVEQILLRCLAKPVDARFATMLQLREALLDPEGYLRGSPPIAPARSVASAFALGEARTMAMQAAGPPGAVPAAMQKTRLAMANPLPLPPPAMSMSGPAGAPTLIAEHAPNPPSARGGPGGPSNLLYAPLRRATTGMPALAPSQEPKMDTMRIATPMGYSSRPPRRVWPAVLGMALLLGVGGGVLSVTCFGHDSGARSGAAEGPAVGSAAGAAGGSAGAAAGSAGGPSGASGTVSGAAGTAAGAAGGSAGTAAGSAGSTVAPGAVASSAGARGPAAATAGATTGASTDTTTDASKGSGAAAGPGTASGSGTAAAGSAGSQFRFPPPVRTAHLTIESVPPGAQVKGPRDRALGKAPVVVEWPMSDVPVMFELRLSGYRTKQKQTVINGNTRLVIELERIPVARHAPGSGSARPATPSNGLMRPDD